MVTASKKRTRKRAKKRAIDQVSRYAYDVIDGKYVVGELVRLACERHIRDLDRTDIYLDSKAIDEIVQFYGFLRHSKGKWAGLPVVLEPWQVFIVGSLVGWKVKATSLRRFKHAHNEVGKKNGKSLLAAGFGLFMAFFDKEPGAEVYAAATKRDQAKIVWGEASRMVKRSPLLKSRITVLNNNLSDSDESSMSKFEPLGADRDQGSEDGVNTHCAIFDELHAFKKRDLWDTIETSTASRDQAIILSITTAGFDRKSLCREQYDYAVRILRQITNADEFFCYIASIDEKDDWQDEANWVKANPNLGVSVNLESLRKDAKKARDIPGNENGFKRYRLNLWTEQAMRWIAIDMWDKGAAAFDPTELRNRECYAGLDLGRVSDFSAFVLLFPPIPCDCNHFADLENGIEADICEHDQRMIVMPYFWIPEENVSDRVRNGQSDLQEWVNEGWLQTTPGNTTDFRWITHQVLEAHGLYDIREVDYDRLFAGEVINDLQDEGVNLEPHGQGYYAMAAPTSEFERLLISELIQHGGHPIMRWMALNAVAIEDPAGNKKPDKSRSGDKIDGIVALVMAISAWMKGVESTKPSIYEERGLSSIGSG